MGNDACAYQAKWKAEVSLVVKAGPPGTADEETQDRDALGGLRGRLAAAASEAGQSP